MLSGFDSGYWSISSCELICIIITTQSDHVAFRYGNKNNRCCIRPFAKFLVILNDQALRLLLLLNRTCFTKLGLSSRWCCFKLFVWPNSSTNTFCVSVCFSESTVFPESEAIFRLCQFNLIWWSQIQPNKVGPLPLTACNSNCCQLTLDFFLSLLIAQQCK